MDYNLMNIILANVVNNAPVEMDEADFFLINDPYGVLMAMLGMGVVFIVLVLMFGIFSLTPKFYTQEFKAWLDGLFTKKQPDLTRDEKATELKKADLSGEVNAAIAAAIYLYRSELHDYENTVLTISKVSRTYSPWSSKIYGLRKTPRRN